MNTCSNCGSHAINPGQNGRRIGVNEHLCDVCYWKAYADDRYEAGFQAGYDAGLDRCSDWERQ
jgi:hypothetical protein